MADEPTVGEVARNQQALSTQLQQVAASKVDKPFHDLQIRELERDRDEDRARTARLEVRVDTLEKQPVERGIRRWVTITAPIIAGAIVAVVAVVAALVIPHIFQ